MDNHEIKGNVKTRHDNELKILKYVRLNSPISRTDICKNMDLSKATITRIINYFIEKGLIREIGTVKTNSGRKPVNIELVDDAYFCIGVNISRNSISTSLVNLGMKVIHNKTINIRNINDVATFQQLISLNIKEILTISKIPQEKILGIGVGVPGIVDYKKGIIKDFASTHGLLDIPLKSYLENIFNLKVYIDNNANTRVLGEYWYGHGIGLKNIINIICSEGVGSGIIVDGNILRGKNNITSGLGHLIINTNGRQCRCGRYGCVEAYSSTESLEEIAKEVLLSNGHSSLIKHIGGLNAIGNLDYKHICKGAAEGDSLCTELIFNAASAVGTGVSNLISIFNPELIVFSGNLIDESDYFFEIVKQSTRKQLFNSLSQDVVFKKRATNDTLYEIGAATMILKDFFND